MKCGRPSGARHPARSARKPQTHLKNHPLTLLSLLAALSPAMADWPTWRGANRDGLSRDTGLLQEWTGDAPNGTPTVAGGMVFVIDRTGNVTAADATTGQRVRQRNLTKDFGGKMESGWGWSESPLVDGDKVSVTPGGPDALLAALDRKTGRTLWKSPTPKFGDPGLDGAAYSNVVVSTAAGRRQYVQLVGRAVVGVDPENGRVLWHCGRVNNGTANIPTPLVWDDHVFVSTGYGTGAALLKIVPDGQGLKAEEVYFLEAKTFQNHHGGMILHDGHLYIRAQGTLLCYDLRKP